MKNILNLTILFSVLVFFSCDTEETTETAFDIELRSEEECCMLPYTICLSALEENCNTTLTVQIVDCDNNSQFLDPMFEVTPDDGTSYCFDAILPTHRLVTLYRNFRSKSNCAMQYTLIPKCNIEPDPTDPAAPHIPGIVSGVLGGPDDINFHELVLTEHCLACASDLPEGG